MNPKVFFAIATACHVLSLAHGDLLTKGQSNAPTRNNSSFAGTHRSHSATGFRRGKTFWIVFPPNRPVLGRSTIAPISTTSPATTTTAATITTTTVTPVVSLAFALSAMGLPGTPTTLAAFRYTLRNGTTVPGGFTGLEFQNANPSWPGDLNVPFAKGTGQVVFIDVYNAATGTHDFGSAILALDKCNTGMCQVPLNNGVGNSNVTIQFGAMIG